MDDFCSLSEVFKASTADRIWRVLRTLPLEGHCFIFVAAPYRDPRVGYGGRIPVMWGSGAPTRLGHQESEAEFVTQALCLGYNPIMPTRGLDVVLSELHLDGLKESCQGQCCQLLHKEK